MTRLPSVQLESQSQKLDAEFIQNKIIEYVAASVERQTPRHLEKAITTAYGLGKVRTKALLKDLICRGELEYTNELGNTYLVLSFNRPVRISDHVVVKPPGHRFQPSPDEVVIQIQPGAAFGGGRHPTTRLSVRAIEYVLRTMRPKWLETDCSVLDIGTGSGILAIVAICLGVKKGLGIDIDPCAVAEAGENLSLNHLYNRLVISDHKIEALDSSYELVTANLRYPSLKNLYSQIMRLTRTGSRVVLSGFRTREMQKLAALYTRRHFESVWTTDEHDWAVVVLNKI